LKIRRNAPDFQGILFASRGKASGISAPRAIIQAWNWPDGIIFTESDLGNVREGWEAAEEAKWESLRGLTVQESLEVWLGLQQAFEAQL
jgi:hypothetical protein